MRFRYTKTVAAVIALGAFCGMSCEDDDDDICTDQVATRTDPSGDFVRYTTFAVQAAGSYPNPPDDVNTNLTMATTSAAEELTENGMRQVNPGDNPDLLLFAISKTTEQSALYWQCAGGYWYGYWSWYWDPCTWVSAVPVEYSVGTLVVGLTDPAQSKIVFGGAIVGILECNDNLSGRIESGVDNIFEDYPYNRR